MKGIRLIRSSVVAVARDWLLSVYIHRSSPRKGSPKPCTKAVGRLGLHDAVMIDGDSSYWGALHVQYWLTFCLAEHALGLPVQPAALTPSIRDHRTFRAAHQAYQVNGPSALSTRSPSRVYSGRFTSG
jgi:hypothetical protein